MRVRTLFALLTAVAALLACAAANAAIDKVVFRDPNYALSWMNQGAADAITDYLNSKGYTTVDAAGLADFMKKHIADRATSVVVMANNVFPDTVMDPVNGTDPNPDCTFNHYLQNGGKVVTLGDWPAYYIALSDGTLTAGGDTRAAAALGFYPCRWNGNTDLNLPVVFNDEGKKWGLTKPWNSVRPSTATDIDIPLGSLQGRPDVIMPWVKTYGIVGRTGAGLVYLYDRSIGAADLDDTDLAQIEAVASYFPSGETTLVPVSGTASTPTGPLANTKLLFTDAKGNVSSVTTDAKGAFTALAAPGTYGVAVSYRGLALPLAPVTIGTAPNQTINVATNPNVQTPPAITDLTASAAGPISATLTWTAPTGDLFAYDVRWGRAPITEANWNSANTLFVAPTAKAGSKETVTVPGLAVLQRYYFAVKPIDTGLKLGAISNVATADTPGLTAWGDGAKGEYYDIAGTGASPDRDTETFLPANLQLTRVDATINLGGSAPASPAPNFPAEHWAVRWSGYVLPPVSEPITFYVASDDGQRLWLSNSPIDPANPGTPAVDNWVDQGETEKPATPIQATAGQKIYFLYEVYQNGGGWAARFRWSSPSIPKQIVPQVYLFSGGTPRTLGRVTGSVVDPSGAPPVGGSVVLTNSTGTATTLGLDGLGTYSALLAPETYTVAGKAGVASGLGGTVAGTSPTVVAADKINIIQPLTVTPVTLPTFPQVVDKAVFYDNTYNTNWVPDSVAQQIRDYFKGKGYTVVDGNALATFMTSHSSIGAKPSVVVMAQDVPPETVVDISSGTVVPKNILSDYLNAGGRIVQLGDIPFWNVAIGGNGGYNNPGGNGALTVLGFNAAGGTWNIGDQTVITAAGNAMGLKTTWASLRPANPGDVDVTLERGQGGSAGWIKLYPDSKGTGMYIRLIDQSLGGPLTNAQLADIQTIAEVSGTITVPGGQPAVVKGDLSGDGKVLVNDAVLALQFAVGLKTPTADQLAAGDLNGDGKITINEVTLILQAAVGLRTL